MYQNYFFCIYVQQKYLLFIVPNILFLFDKENDKWSNKNIDEKKKDKTAESTYRGVLALWWFLGDEMS